MPIPGGHLPNILVIFSENPVKLNKFWSIGGGAPGAPSPKSATGYPFLGQDRMWYPLLAGWGYPQPDLGRGYPPLNPDLGPGWRYLQPEQHSMYLPCGRQYASCIQDQDGEYPLPRSGQEGMSLPRSGWGVPDLGPGLRVPSNQNSIACTCYAAGGMPLAFTQKDFLVRFWNHILLKTATTNSST